MRNVTVITSPWRSMFRYRLGSGSGSVMLWDVLLVSSNLGSMFASGSAGSVLVSGDVPGSGFVHAISSIMPA